MTRSRCAVAVGALLLTQAACAGDAAHAGPSTTRVTAGDTSVVRTAGEAARYTTAEEVRIGAIEGADAYTFGEVSDVAVGDDGRIFVLDGQALEVRVFSPDGRHLSSFGRAGGGPGEFKQPGGMVFLADGRLAVRDPGNTRMNIYSAEGESLTSWPIPGGYFTSAPIFADRAGHVYMDVISDRDSVTGAWQVGLMRLRADGTVVDTVPRPHGDFDPPLLRAERVSAQGTSRSLAGVPFWPSAYSTLNRNGEFVGGISDRYAIHTWRADGTMQRVERDIAAVAVDPGEAETARERTTRSMRGLDPSWNWSGPQPPATKPYFRDVRTGDDGRIWVQRSQPATKLPPDPDARPHPAGLPALDRYVEPVVWDVFEEDGTLFGTVSMPDRFRPLVFQGDHVWGVLRDELDVMYVVRLRLTPASAEPGS